MKYQVLSLFLFLWFGPLWAQNFALTENQEARQQRCVALAQILNQEISSETNRRKLLMSYKRLINILGKIILPNTSLINRPAQFSWPETFYQRLDYPQTLQLADSLEHLLGEFFIQQRFHNIPIDQDILNIATVLDNQMRANGDIPLLNEIITALRSALNNSENRSEQRRGLLMQRIHDALLNRYASQIHENSAFDLHHCFVPPGDCQTCTPPFNNSLDLEAVYQNVLTNLPLTLTPIRWQDRVGENTSPRNNYPLGININTTHNYSTRDDIEVCYRSADIPDTIILHHTEGPPDRSVDEINAAHLARNWHMIGYNFIIQGEYRRLTPRHALEITQGRPMEMIGSHAGGNRNINGPSDRALRERIRPQRQICRINANNRTLPSQRLTNIMQDGAISANVTSIGVAVTGDYGDHTRIDENATRIIHNRPTRRLLRRIGQFICSLQKRHPNLTKLKKHSEINRRKTCPGSLGEEDNMNIILRSARKLGCRFTQD